MKCSRFVECVPRNGMSGTCYSFDKRPDEALIKGNKVTNEGIAEITEA